MYQGKDILFIDLEMTGNHEYFKTAQEIIEVGLIMVENYNESNEDVISKSFKVKPKGEVNPYVSRMTNIYPEDLIFEKGIEYYKDTICKYIENADLIVLHGASEDKRALKAIGIEIPSNIIYDTEVEFRKRYPNAGKSNLRCAGEMLSIEVINSHNAIADAKTTLNIFRTMNSDTQYI